jgi:hypothetical protein
MQTTERMPFLTLRRYEHIREGSDGGTEDRKLHGWKDEKSNDLLSHFGYAFDSTYHIDTVCDAATEEKPARRMVLRFYKPQRAE